jgi:hypothetical protein
MRHEPTPIGIGSPGPIGKAGIAGQNSLPWSSFMAARPFKLAV